MGLVIIGSLCAIAYLLRSRNTDIGPLAGVTADSQLILPDKQAYMALSVGHAHIAAAGHVTRAISSTFTSQTRWLEAQTASNVQSRLLAIWKSSCKLCDSKHSLWTAVGALPHSRTLWLRGSDTANKPTNSSTSLIKPVTCASATQHPSDLLPIHNDILCIQYLKPISCSRH